MIGPTDVAARHVLRQFAISEIAARHLGNYGGFSGARLWRVSTPTGDFCLKAWPPDGMTPERHCDIVRLVRHAGQTGLTFIPTTSDHIEYSGRIWDLADWMPGSADTGAISPPGRVHAACVALARLHLAWGKYASPAAPCPAVIRRLDAVRAWKVAVPPTFKRADPVSLWVNRAHHLVSEHIEEVRRLLDSWREIPLLRQPCVCDIWRAHVLFTGDAVTGMIDFGAVKLDNVAVDLARLLGSLVGDDRPRFQAGLDAYTTIRQLSDAERNLAVVLDRTGVVLGLANWLYRLAGGEPDHDDRMAVARRIGELVERMQRW